MEEVKPASSDSGRYGVRLKDLWYRCCHWLCACIYFERITVLHRDRLPGSGPVLYICLHRNGAVDGFVYHQVAPRGVFMISTQLLRSFFARMFFSGIAVARKSDAEDSGRNAAALDECVGLLAGGGALMVFPEGTSSLGPRHLPFKSGAAKLAVDALGRGVPLRIVPLGIHYEEAWAFRSKVEIVVGEPVATELPDGLGEMGRLKEMKRRMDAALEAVGVNFGSSEAMDTATKLAYAMTLGTGRHYFPSLKALEKGVPEPLAKRWEEMSAEAASRGLLRHQGVPLFPGTSWWIYALALVLLGPPVVGGALVNFPPLLLGWLAARKLADDLNVIALWRILVGLPVFLVWAAGMVAGLVAFAGAWWAFGYIILTIFSLAFLYRTRKLAVAVWNGSVHRPFRKRAWEFHRLLMGKSPTE